MRRNYSVCKRYLFWSGVMSLFCLSAYLSVGGYRQRKSEEENRRLLEAYYHQDSVEVKHYLTNSFADENNLKNVILCLNKGVIQVSHYSFNLNDVLSTGTVLSNDEKKAFTNAKEFLERGLKINKTDAVLNHNLAWINLYLGNSQKALIYFLLAVKLNQGNSLYKISLGLFYERNHNYKLAWEQYILAVTQSPEVLDSEFFIDLELRNGNEATNIIKEVKYHLEKDSSNLVAKSKLGRIYIYLKLFNKAGKVLNEVTSKLPNLNRPWYYLSCLAQETGDSSQIEKYLKRAILLDESDYLPYILIGRFYKRTAQTQKALAFLYLALFNYSRMYSEHSFHSKGMYYNTECINNDIIPYGLLQYNKPLINQKAICSDMAALYMTSGDKKNALLFEQIALGKQPLKICKFFF